LKVFELRERSWAWADVQRQDEPHNPGFRQNFDFQVAIHDIFRDELMLDKDYELPRAPSEDHVSAEQS
jgi:hypothetical protein